MDGDKSGESGAFLFSRRVPDFCDGRRSFPINENSKFVLRGRRRWISLITNPLNCWAPIPVSQIKMASLENVSDSYLESLAQEAKKNDVAFMDIIKEFPVIYNGACADFKDRNIKNNAWRKISDLLDLEESKCKQRYESIRTTFSRYVRKALGKSGAGRDDIQLDPKYEHLRWLATFIKTRPTSGNVQLVREVSEEQTNSNNGESEEEEDKFPPQETSPSR